MQNIETLHGTIETPAFLPDATYGAVKTLSFADVENSGIRELVTTTLHLEQNLGSDYIRKFGGLHKFFNWQRPILTDSGGFQVFSLVYRRENKQNLITDAGVSFINPSNGSYNLLTPEISQIIQHNLGSDIRVVLDEPTNRDGPISEAKQAIKRTTDWARRSKKKFLELNNLTEQDFNNPEIKRPLLVAVIQGGNYFDLRKQSAEELLEIGFDIYGFGGLPLHNTKSWKEGAPTGFYHELLDFVTNLVPKDSIKYGLGIGTPDDLEYCVGLGWQLFDTVLPTRNARHGYLYVPKGLGDKSFGNYDVMHVKSERYKFDEAKITPGSPFDVSRAYLRHLIRVGDPAGFRIASMHNLQFYSQTMERLRGLNSGAE